jgi:phenylalanyl-tRNA synthetase beta subunit
VSERIEYEDVITYPAVRQDIAVVVDDDVETGALVDAAREAAGDDGVGAVAPRVPATRPATR